MSDSEPSEGRVDDYAALDALAAAATPGPWVVVIETQQRVIWSEADECRVARVPYTPNDDSDYHDAAYIAAASPDVIRRLIADLTEARETITQQRVWREDGWTAERAARRERDAAEAEVAALVPLIRAQVAEEIRAMPTHGLFGSDTYYVYREDAARIAEGTNRG